jgi:hypothetical protein
MSEDRPQHLREITLELIFRQGQRILGELSQIREKLDEVILCVGKLERQVAELHVDNAIIHQRLDNLDQRITRVERRLDLVGSIASGYGSRGYNC